MKKFFKILFIVGTLVNYKCFAEDEPSAQNIDPIDLKFKQCMADAQNITSKIINCTYDCCENWNETLDKVYQQLLSRNELINKKKFIETQKAWLKYHDNELKVISNILSRLSNTMDMSIWWISKAGFIKKRAMQLRGYLEYIETHSP